MKGKIAILFLVISAFCLLSCRTVNVGTYEKKENIRPAKLIENVMQNTPLYNMASYKFSAEYSANGSSSNTFSGNLRVCRDSVMWLSIRSFNIEGFRVLVSPDSVKIMDRINNSYYAEEFSALDKLLKVDLSFNDLQSILLNEFFCYSNDSDTAKMYSDYKTCMDTIYYCISTVSPKRISRMAERIERSGGGYAEHHETVVQTVKILPVTFRIKNMYLEDLETGRNAIVEYDKFFKFNNILFPQEMNISIESGNFNADIKFSISDFEVNEEFTFPFKIPSKYTKIELNEKNR